LAEPMRIGLAMIQSGNYFDDQARGYAVAESLITAAATEGADMVVLPELSGCGYIPNPSVWQYAEPVDGKTARWACELSKRFEIHVGAGFVETDGSDFYNSYLISSPSGEVCGVIRKEDAESSCFKREPGELYIDTEIGRVGVGICADNHYVDRLRRMKDANVDFVIMPHANPAPIEASRRVSPKDLDTFREQPLTIAAAYSNYLRVPTVYVNAVGAFPEFDGGFGVKNFHETFQLRGGSLVVDADGTLASRMGSEVGYAVCEIQLAECVLPVVEPDVFDGKWLHPGNKLFRHLVLPYYIQKGMKRYNMRISQYRNQTNTISL